MKKVFQYKIKPNVDLNILSDYGYEITQSNWEEPREECFEAVKITNIGEIVVHEGAIIR